MTVDARWDAAFMSRLVADPLVRVIADAIDRYARDGLTFTDDQSIGEVLAEHVAAELRQRQLLVDTADVPCVAVHPNGEFRCDGVRGHQRSADGWHWRTDRERAEVVSWLDR